MQGLRRSLFLITLPLATFGCLASMDTAKGQIIPDNTLGAEKSVVNTFNVGIPVDVINGGATRGKNLFHSFREFNVGEGRAAAFYNPDGIENILSRVTGNNPSNILGLLGVLGKANLFFINPNGIIFGLNGALYVNGSFLASTANSLVFDNGFEFSATNPKTPSMLTVNVPIGLQFRENPGRIIYQPVADDVRLQVASGKTLSLVGGDISLDRGRLTAAGGQITLGSLAGAGTVGLNSDGSLSFPDGVARGNVSITNGAQLSSSNYGKGDTGNINLRAESLSVTNATIDASTYGKGDAGNINLQVDGSVLLTGNTKILSSVGNLAEGNGGNISITADSVTVKEGAQVNAFTRGRGDAGNVTIQARGAVSFDGVDISDGFPSTAISNVDTGGIGNGGEISIKAGSLSLTNGGQLGVLVRAASSNLAGGRGTGGNVNIQVRDALTISGKNTNTLSGIYSSLGFGAEGNGGNIKLRVGSLSVTNATIDASAYGKGYAGNINLQAHGSVLLTGDDTVIVSNMENSAQGNGGNISITADSLTVKEGAQVNAFTRGRGDAGNVTIQARGAVSFDGVSISDGFPSAAFSTVEAGSVGNGGQISIKAGSLSLTNGGQLGVLVRAASSNLAGGRGTGGNVNIQVRDALTISGKNTNTLSGIYSSLGFGAEGNGGNIDLRVGSLSVTNATIDASTEGQGDAGSINLQVDGSVLLTGNTNIFSSVRNLAEGNGGNISITADSLTVKEGAQVNALTRGRGDAGNVTIQARGAVSFDGVDISDGEFPSAAISTVEAGSVGNGGNININAGSLSLTNGAQLTAHTSGKGNAGIIKINATDTVSFDGVGSNGFASGAFSYVEQGGVGNGGVIKIATKNLNLTNGATVNVGSKGKGNAGNLYVIDSNKLTLYNEGSLTAQSEIGKGGNIFLRVRDILLRRQSEISSTGSHTVPTSEGSIDIVADTLVLLENSKIITDASDPQGGSNIKVSGLHGKPIILVSRNSRIKAAGELNIEPNLKVQPLEVPDVKLIDPTEQIAQNPCQRGVGSKFIITGRGGLPPSPNEATSSDAVRVDLVEPAPGGSGGAGGQRRRGAGEKGKSSVTKPIVPAQGWIFDKNGEVMLTGYDPTGTGLQRPVNSDVCPVP